MAKQIIIEMDNIEKDLRSWAVQGIESLLVMAGADPGADGLSETPERVIKSFLERCQGYHADPAQILSKRFKESADEMVVLSDIEFTSNCEHHLLPFIGKAAVGYIPNGEVVGISKLARLVDCFAQRLQIQERLTDEIAGAVNAHLLPIGVGVIVEAHHHCMSCRGVRKQNSKMITSSLRGVMKEKPEARAEFFRLAGY